MDRRVQDVSIPRRKGRKGEEKDPEEHVGFHVGRMAEGIKYIHRKKRNRGNTQIKERRDSVKQHRTQHVKICFARVNS